MARPVVFPHRRIALPVATLQSIESPLPPDLGARCQRAGRTGHSMAKLADPGKTAPGRLRKLRIVVGLGALVDDELRDGYRGL